MESTNNVSVVSNENYLRELVFMLSVRKGLIFLTALIIFLSVVMIALFWPPSYRANAKVLISQNAVEPSLGTLEKVDYRIEKVSKEDLNSEAQLLKSTDLLSRVVLELREKSIVFTNIPDPENEERWLSKKIQQLSNAIVVDAIPYSKVLDISLVWGDAKESKVLLDHLLARYLTYRIEMEGYTDKDALFTGLSKEYLDRIKLTKNKLAEVMTNQNVISPELEIKNNLEIKFSLERVLGDGQLEEISLESRIELLVKKINEKDIQFFSFLENEAITQFSKQIQELFIEKAKSEGVFVSESKAVQGMDLQLKAAYKNLLSEVGSLQAELVSQLGSIQTQNALLSAKIEDINVRNRALKLAKFNIDSLENENKVLQSSFETFFKRKEEAVLASNSVINDANVSILSSPKLPLSASFPNKRVLIPFGFIVACLSGLIVGFLTEFLDHTFKRPSDIARVLSVDSLISITNIK